MSGMDGQRVACVVAVHGEYRGQQAAIDTDGVHGLHHVGARDLRRPGQNLGPGAARMIAFVAVNLGINRHHEIRPPRPLSFSKGLSHSLAKLAEPALPREARLRRLAKASGLTRRPQTGAQSVIEGSKS